VAELVDAQVSEACCRKAVEVRFFSSAPNIEPVVYMTAGFFAFCAGFCPIFVPGWNKGMREEARVYSTI
jgi:hypothetical protein